MAWCLIFQDVTKHPRETEIISRTLLWWNVLFLTHVIICTNKMRHAYLGVNVNLCAGAGNEN